MYGNTRLICSNGNMVIPRTVEGVRSFTVAKERERERERERNKGHGWRKAWWRDERKARSEEEEEEREERRTIRGGSAL